MTSIQDMNVAYFQVLTTYEEQEYEQFDQRTETETSMNPQIEGMTDQHCLSGQTHF